MAVELDQLAAQRQCPMKTHLLCFAALDLHSATSVLGWMDAEGRLRGMRRFATTAEALRREVGALGGSGVALALEASGLCRWALGQVRPLVECAVVCEPRHNRLIAANPAKHDEADVENLCLLLRLDRLKPVWIGTDPQRQLHRELVYELLNLRDAISELKSLIKARYRQWGVLRVEGTRLFGQAGRDSYVEKIAEPERRGILRRLYAQLDALARQWRDTLGEVERAGAAFWEIGQFQKVPGIGRVGAHVFAAIIEEPGRFRTPQQVIKYARLAICERSSDGKPLGYQRLDRRGHGELKLLSYHAWRTACRRTTGANAIQQFYRASRERTGSARHARLSTQRKILVTLWRIWLRRQPYDPARFSQATDAPPPAAHRSAPAPPGG